MRVTTENGGIMLAEWLQGGGGTKEEACFTLNITGAQFNRFLARVRDVVATATSEPVAYDPVTYEYSFARENGEATAYTLHRQKIARKQLVRLRAGTVLPAQAKFGTEADLHAQRYARYLDNTIAELTELIALTETANGNQPA